MNPYVRLCVTVTVTCLGWTHLAAADFLADATIRIKPGNNQSAGLRRPEGDATIILIADDSQAKLADVDLLINSPDSLYKFYDRTNPCTGSGQTAYQQWTYKIAAPEPNTDVWCIFKGQVTGCKVQGGGGPAPFEASIVHLDLDVDSDNTSEAITAQKQPAEQGLAHKLGQYPLADAQDKKEDPRGSEDQTNPGLLLVVNHGFEQNPYDITAPKEDWERSGTELKDATDPDLAKARIQITGNKPGKLKLTYSKTKLRVYKEDKTYLAPGIEQDVSPGEIKLLLEGINPGGTNGSSRITALFQPQGSEASGNSKANDTVKVTVVDLQLQVDRDRNGMPTGTGQDLTNKDHPFVFWYNNDDDSSDSFADTQPGSSPDFDRDGISSLRDLEDFQRMRLVVRGADKYLLAGKPLCGLRWMAGATNKPKVSCFRNDDIAGTLKYLEDESVATATFAQAERIAVVDNQTPRKITKDFLKPETQSQVASMLWKCNGEGERPADPEGKRTTAPAEGQLASVLLLGSRVVALNRHLHLRLGDMRNFYEHWTAGDAYTTESSFPAPRIFKATDSPIDLSATQAVGLWDPELIGLKGTKAGVLFVHGYRMKTWERRAYAETMYKRMYWNGFNGKFVLLSWPTEYHESPNGAAIFAPQNYDRSEFTARRSGYALAEIVRNAKSRLDVNLLCVSGHSMGNVVVCEALRKEKETVADMYLAFQSAEAAGAFKIGSPPKVLQGGVYGFVTPGGYAPDLYAFDQPRQRDRDQVGRGLVSWEQWNKRDIIYYDSLGNPTYGGPHLNQDEQLVPVVDGQPLHRNIVNAVPQRIAYVNSQDPATAGAWVANQVTKVDGGFTYSPRWRNQLTDIVPRYVDDYLCAKYADILPWSRFDKRLMLVGQPQALMRWRSRPGTASQQSEYAGVLAFISEPISGPVGASKIGVLTSASTVDQWGKPLTANVQEAIFTGGFDAEEECGFGNNSEHDHSGQFAYYLSRAKGPRQFWLDVLKRISTGPSTVPVTGQP